MTVAIAPAGLAPTGPSVGIFWKIDHLLVIDYSSLDDAEVYGDCLTHSRGHYERWEDWQKLGLGQLERLGYPSSIVSSEYDEWPRGRVVHEITPNRFVLYADRRLQKPGIIAALTRTLNLEAQSMSVMSDAHYR